MATSRTIAIAALRRAEPAGAPVFGVTVAGIVVAAVCAAALDRAAVLYPSTIPLAYLIVAAIALACWRIGYTETAAPFRSLCRGVAFICGVFALIHPPSYDLSHMAAPVYWGVFFSAGYYSAVAGAALALWRPLWILLPASYIHLHTAASNHVTGIESSSLDYIPASQSGLFLAAGLATAIVLVRGRRRTRGMEADAIPAISSLLAAAAIGLHFASYFHSGIAKLSLDGGVTSWLLQNDVSNRYLAALDNGVLPLASWPDFTAWLYRQLHAHHAAANLIVVAAQLSAVLAVTRPRWIILLTLVFDALHIGIYVTSGANFWPWLGLNLAIACAAAGFRAAAFTGVHRALAMAMIAVSPPFFFVARLAWYDTPASNNLRIVAEFDDGWLYELPVSFFRSKSYPVAYMSLGTPPGHFPTTTLAGTSSFVIARKAARCDPALRDRRGPRERSLEAVDAFVQQHHRHVLETPAPSPAALGGRLDHFISDPRRVADLATIDPRRIAAYRYIVESVCLGYHDGQFTRRVDHRTERRIDVAKQ